MAASATNDARLSFRLSSELKRDIEVAAALAGQTVSGFATSVLAGAARTLIGEHERTMLSHRDRERFIALLDDAAGRPNEALSAARKYKRRAQ